MGATKNNAGGHLKIRGTGKIQYEGAYEISWRFQKIEGARLSGGLLQRGVLKYSAPKITTSRQMQRNEYSYFHRGCQL